MSRSLLDQLEAYGADFETALTPTELDDVVTDRRGIGLAPEASSVGYPRLGWATAAVAVVMVVVLVGGVAWLLGGTPERDVVQTTVASVVAPASSYRWSRISPETAELGGEFHQ